MTSGEHDLVPGPPPSGPDVRGPDGLRIGDAERASVADRLAWHFSHGRLDQAELEDRLDQIMRAKTKADLAGLLTDLPESDQQRRRAVQASHRQLRRELRDTRRTASAHRARGLTWIPAVAGVIVAVAWVAHTLTHSVAAWIVVLAIAVLWLRRGRVMD